MSLIFALVLFGCADDGTECQRISAQPAHFPSKALCEAGQESALQSEVAVRSDHPLVVTKCLRTRTAAAGQQRVKLSYRTNRAREVAT